MRRAPTATLQEASSRVYVLAMVKKETFRPGDEVQTTRTRGVIIDIAATPSGQFIFGVEDADGEVTYFTPKALRHV
ncbi:DNA polymerase II small subunit/DNA polymerase delta subunit B [Microbacterium natoriense]|uniref:DNA polymerase II small subunit/DNA polymerase delta subunit B n=2 Tax=Microbacteriaceae TaxID=85023 RepID=A0AAW8EVM3_9MICO|nr:DNA polymerase II small subunit/DNA polymerase delta subunit B [Microbacterium natoriense]